jgi:hypothetical protein
MLPYPVIHQHGARFSIIPTSLWRALRGPAVYILGRDDGDHVARPLYVGETERLDGYIGPGHHKWQQALNHGMNVVCVHHDRRGAQFRRNLETILRRQYRPALNEPTVPAFPPNPLAGALAPLAEPPAPNPLAGSRS